MLTSRSLAQIVQFSGASVSTDPYAAIDGSLTAPVVAAGPQHPTWLNDEPYRPPWKVAGVDYPVGYADASAPTKDPTAGGLPTGASYSSRTITISQDNVVLDGWDCTVATGVKINCNSHVCTIRNCKFAYSASLAAPIINGAGNATILNNILDGANIDVSGAPCLIYAASSTNMLLEYNWIKNSGSDVFSLSAGTLVWRWNLLENSGVISPGNSGAHPDFFQWVASGEVIPTIEFNTLMQNCGALGTPGETGFSQGAYLVCSGSFGNTSVSYNTMRSSPGATPTGAGSQMHYWVSGLISPATLAGGATITVANNYADMTNCSGFAYNRTSATFSGNIDMQTGSAA